jgi:uncharacterized cupin superfamily protein
VSIAALCPVTIDGGSVATMALPEKEPFEQLNGAPLGTRGLHLWTSADRSTVIGVWECDAYRFWADFGDYSETIHIISGEFTCTAMPEGLRSTLISSRISGRRGSPARVKNASYTPSSTSTASIERAASSIVW